VEIGAAELAIGDGMQPDVGLELDDLGNRLVFTARNCSALIALLAYCSRACSR
jgi:hypothetical protein